MARISVEQKALTDPRFELLGRFLQSNRHEALGRMILVWNECQERNTYTLPEKLVSAIMGDRDGSRWVCESDLAIRVNKSEVRIKGTQGRIEWLDAKRKAARINGKRGGRPPGTHLEPMSVADGLQEVAKSCRTETPPAPAPALNTPLPPKGGKRERRKQEEHPLFARFWEVYPRKVARDRAAEAFNRINPSEDLLAVMLATLSWQKRSDQWQRNAGEFIPHPSSWLNGKRWEDRPTVEFSAPASTKPNPLTDNPPRATPMFPSKVADCG